MHTKLLAPKMLKEEICDLQNVIYGHTTRASVIAKTTLIKK